jgi:hypothetical protein
VLDRKEFYATLLKDFLDELYLNANLTEAELSELPDWNWRNNDFRDLYSDIERWRESGDEAWEQWRTKMLAETEQRLKTEFRIFGEQLYQKYSVSPGQLCGELSRMIAEAREILPHNFKIALQHLQIIEFDDSLSLYVWVVFIDVKLLEDFRNTRNH